MASQRAPKSSKTSPWPAKSRPEANFPNLIEKPYKPPQTSLKSSKKNPTRAQSGSQVSIIAVKSSFLEFVSEIQRIQRICLMVRNGSQNCGSDPPSTRIGGQDDGSLNKLPQINVGFLLGTRVHIWTPMEPAYLKALDFGSSMRLDFGSLEALGPWGLHD